jgi:hypothetical protein
LDARELAHQQNRVVDKADEVMDFIFGKVSVLPAEDQEPSRLGHDGAGQLEGVRGKQWPKIRRGKFCRGLEAELLRIAPGVQHLGR